MAETFECPKCNIINEMNKVLTVISKRQIICIDCKYKIKEKKSIYWNVVIQYVINDLTII